MADDEVVLTRAIEVEAELHVRAEAGDDRVIEGRIVPFNVPAMVMDMNARTLQPTGRAYREVIVGMADFDPTLMVLENGVADPGRPHRGPLAGRGLDGSVDKDGATVAFRMLRTTAGNDLYELAREGLVVGLSIEMEPHSPSRKLADGTVERTAIVRRVAAVNKGAYAGAQITAVRAAVEEAPVAETETAAAPATEPAAPVLVDVASFNAAVASMGETFTRTSNTLLERITVLEENRRTEIVIPGRAETQEISRGQWMKTVLRALSGEPVPELQTRVMADLITSDNLGVVPEAFSPEMIGIIDAGRPFLGSTRRVPTPDSGMTMNMPVIETRPTAGVQVNEKDDITSTQTSITSTGFDAVTIAGGGDLSLQILKRSSPSFLTLYLELLAEALSENAEAEALAALIAAGMTPGTGSLDPEALAIGEAWVNARAARQRADTMWLSSDAVAEFIDAKVSGTNAPLYANLAADITVGGGPGGRISGLRPVHVPALDDTAVDVIVGPSRGFAWAEDGAFTLQTDVPSKAGRDVALVVIDWYAPLYPDAFTSYAL